MKTLINESLQSLQVCILAPGTNLFKRIPPRGRLVVRDDQLSEMAMNLAKRKLIKIVSTPDFAVAQVSKK
jgi:hypothetical protein